MSDSEMTVEDYQELFDEWHEDYEIQDEFIEYSEENWAKVQAMDPRYVWTNHSTCENEKITNGASIYNGCCWETFGWYIGNVPWGDGSTEYFEQVEVTAYLPCPKCNPDGEGDGDEDCDEPDCDGSGYINHYFD